MMRPGALIIGARTQATKDFMELGSGDVLCQLYNGSAPSAGGTPTTLLSEIILARPIGVITSNVIVLSVPRTGLILASGTATWARFINGNGDFAYDCDVGVVGSGKEVQMASTELFAGGTAILVSGLLA